MENDPKTLNAHQAADFLNAHVETLRRLARKGNIPAFKIGKDWRFQKEDLIYWARTQYLQNRAPAILVVDDEKPIRQLIRLLLEKEGYRVIEAENGAVGLRCLREETIHLVLLDLEMPEINGVQFLDALRHAQIEIPVILVTAFPDSQLMIDAMRYSPLLLIAKPFKKQQLLRSITAVKPLHAGTHNE